MKMHTEHKTMTPDSHHGSIHNESHSMTAKTKTTKLRGLSVRQKINFGFGGLILLMATSLGITLYNLNDVEKIATSVIDERLPATNLFQRLGQDLNFATTLLNNYLLTGEHDLRNEYENLEADLFGRLKYTYGLSLTLSGEIDTEQLDHAKQRLEQFAVLVDTLFEMRDTNTANRGLILAQNTLNPPALQFLNTINILLESEDFDSDDPQIDMAYKKLSELRYIWVQVMRNMQIYIATQSKVNLANFKEFYKRASVLLSEVMQMNLDIGFGELDDMEEHRKTYASRLQPVIEIFSSDEWRTDAHILRTETRPILDALRLILENITDSQMDKTWESGQSLTNSQQQIRYSTTLILVVGFLLGSLLALRISGGIVRPIHRLMEAAKQVASGDLNAEIMVTSRDEIGQLSGSFNEMVNGLRSAAIKEQSILDELQELNQELESRVADRTKDLEQSEIKIRAVLDNIGEGILVLDNDGRVESINTAGQKIFNIKEHEAVGIHSNMLIKFDETHGAGDAAEKSLLTNSGDQQSEEHVGHRPDGSTFPIEYVVTSMNIGDEIRYVCILRDITQRKETEASLADAQGQLVDAAHKSGMADMATGVLHNIGNILNSVNLSGEEIQRISAASKISGLVKANDLLQSQENMNDFLANDSRGQKLPAYFIKMGKVLNDEVNDINKESKALIQKTTMMREVISTQQSYAKSGLHIEQLNLPELVEDALKIQETSLKKWGVRLDKNYADTPDCMGQKSKLLQVITNLIKNAKEAMDDNDQFNRPKELHIETGITNDAALYLTIRDNGCGISEEMLTKVFNHGFTTKETGHGFGLHTCANAMTEMKGTLKVGSEGTQKGATFTLTIPAGKSA